MDRNDETSAADVDRANSQYIRAAHLVDNFGVEHEMLDVGCWIEREAFPAYTGDGKMVVFFNNRGDLGRTPMVNQTDILLAHDFKIKGSTRLSLQANIANVFDQDTVTGIATAAYRDALTIPGFPGNPGGAFFQPGGFDTVALMQAANRANATTGRPSPLYKQANAFQGARSIRVMARISF